MKSFFVLMKRNIQSILRDPLSLVFCLIFPLFMLILLESLLGNIDEAGTAIFKITSYAPGIAIFGQTFLMLFAGSLVAFDFSSSFTSRILVAPVKPPHFFWSYFFAIWPFGVLQTLLFYLVALCFGLPFQGAFFLSLGCSILTSAFYVMLGILFGTLCRQEKQVGPLCSIVISGAGLLGGVWLPIELFGGVFEDICRALPFFPTVSMLRFPFEEVDHLMWIFIAFFIYFIVATTLAIFFFKRRIKN